MPRYTATPRGLRAATENGRINGEYDLTLRLKLDPVGVQALLSDLDHLEVAIEVMEPRRVRETGNHAAKKV